MARLITTENVTIGAYRDKHLIEYPDRPMSPENDPDYWDRVKRKLPIRPPHHLPGDLVTNRTSDTPRTVKFVEWANTNPNIPPFWRIDGLKEVNVYRVERG